MTLLDDVIQLIRKHALINAYEHGGRAIQGPVLGKVIAERPDLRSQAKSLVNLVAQIVNEVNRMSIEDIKREVEEKYPEVLVKRREVEEKVLPPLPNVESYEMVVTRFAPNPDAPLHLGSLRPLILSYEYAKMYKGRFILRFDDTDPKTKRPMPEAYEWIIEDMKWLGIEPDEVVYQSDRLRLYYDVCKDLLRLGGAYVCTCSQEEFRLLRDEGKPCPCRDLGPEEHLERFEGMLSSKYGEKEAVVRIKTDLSHPDISVREWVAFRIIDVEKYPHPRVGSKYFVWPTYNFACAVDDHALKVSHILRAKEHITNTIKQKYVFNHMSWKFPETIHFGRLKLANIILSKSQISKGIARGEFSWWDDPRLGTVMAIRRRGILPETLREIILHVGIKSSEASLSWENIYSVNRKHLDSRANRYFCVLDPVEMVIKGVEGDFVAKPLLHPDFPERGCREIRVEARGGEARVYLSKRDLELLKQKPFIRLMSLFNVQIESIERDLIIGLYKGESIEDALLHKAPIIQWVPVNENVEVEIVMPNASVASGFAERNLETLDVGSIVQLVRVGFARLDFKRDGKLKFYFAHD
ncbi:MAG: glutamate--tRNA ligase [Candidatus Nezhaarchaeales archaeon]|nr:glutamate--tRNA ligase [Candidatus Nezhaarchaeota archaeon]